MTDAGRALAAARDAWTVNDWAAQERHALAAIQATRDDAEKAMAFHHLGLALYHRNAADDARAAYNRAIELYAKCGDRQSVAFVQVSLGSLELDVRGDYAAARRYYDAALPLLRERGGAPLGIALGNVGEAQRLEGEYESALRSARESLGIFREVNDTNREGWQLVVLANCHTLLRRYEDAFSSLREAYEALSQQSNPRWYAHYFDAWLMLAVSLRRWETAAILAGFIDRYRHENAVPRLAGLAPWYRLSVGQIERHLEADALFLLRMQGAKLSVEQAQGATRGITA